MVGLKTFTLFRLALCMYQGPGYIKTLYKQGNPEFIQALGIKFYD